MPAATHPDTDELLDRAGQGDVPARQQLLVRHRARLRQMVAVAARPPARRPRRPLRRRPGGAGRGRPAPGRLPPRPPAAVLPLAAPARLGAAGRACIAATSAPSSGASSARSRGRCPCPTSRPSPWPTGWWPSGTSPSRHLLREELRERVRAALDRWRRATARSWCCGTWSSSPSAEVAAVLGITEGAAKARHMRALTRLRALLEDETREEDR